MIESFGISIARILQDYRLAMAMMIFDTQFDYIIVRRAQYHWRYMDQAMIVVELSKTDDKNYYRYRFDINKFRIKGVKDSRKYA
jgi:hypothetical protein